MKGYVFAILAVGAFGAPTFAAADCASDYKDFVMNPNREKLAQMSPAEIADLSSTALRGFEACTAGDERFSAQNFFRKLDELGPHSRSSDIFNSGAFNPPGAKK
jgi:hypothetical protein